MYNFVIECSDEELLDFRKVTSLEAYQRENPERALKILLGPWVWCMLTYVALVQRGNIDVSLSNKYDENSINLAHSNTMINMPGEPTQFIVCIQADYSRRGWAQYHLVQNKNQVGVDASFIPLWVHPGLIGRSAGRTEIRRVAYAGQTFNNNLAGTTSTWEDLLKPHGVEFAAIANDSWHDLSTIDILVGVRSFDTKPYDKKPPSKLINAWHAQIPFIGGHDSAYKQIGVPEEDYLLVQTPEQVVAAILRLRNDSELYSKLVRNGSIKAVHYTDDRIADIWEGVLTGPVLERYKVWQKHRKLEAIRFSLKQRLGLLEHQAKRTIKGLLKAIGR